MIILKRFKQYCYGNRIEGIEAKDANRMQINELSQGIIKTKFFMGFMINNKKSGPSIGFSKSDELDEYLLYREFKNDLLHGVSFMLSSTDAEPIKRITKYAEYKRGILHGRSVEVSWNNYRKWGHKYLYCDYIEGHTKCIKIIEIQTETHDGKICTNIIIESYLINTVVNVLSIGNFIHTLEHNKKYDTKEIYIISNDKSHMSYKKYLHSRELSSEYTIKDGILINYMCNRDGLIYKYKNDITDRFYKEKYIIYNVNNSCGFKLRHLIAEYSWNPILNDISSMAINISILPSSNQQKVFEFDKGHWKYSHIHCSPKTMFGCDI